MSLKFFGLHTTTFQVLYELRKKLSGLVAGDLAICGRLAWVHT